MASWKEKRNTHTHICTIFKIPSSGPPLLPLKPTKSSRPHPHFLFPLWASLALFLFFSSRLSTSNFPFPNLLPSFLPMDPSEEPNIRAMPAPASTGRKVRRPAFIGFFFNQRTKDRSQLSIFRRMRFMNPGRGFGLEAEYGVGIGFVGE
jgi:hypothetical protein